MAGISYSFARSVLEGEAKGRASSAEKWCRRRLDELLSRRVTVGEVWFAMSSSDYVVPAQSCERLDGSRSDKTTMSFYKDLLHLIPSILPNGAIRPTLSISIADSSPVARQGEEPL
jgi:hypothetical protein